MWTEERRCYTDHRTKGFHILFLCIGVCKRNGFARYYTPLCFLGVDAFSRGVIALARYSRTLEEAPAMQAPTKHLVHRPSAH